MKTLLTLLLGCAFSAALAGCAASATVDPNGDQSKTVDKTTVVHPNGSTDTQTETHTSP